MPGVTTSLGAIKEMVKIEFILNWTRSLHNDSWFNKFPHFEVEVLDPLISNHILLLVPRPKAFKLQNFWMKHKEYPTILNKVWSKAYQGSPMEILVRKLRYLKKKQLNKQH